EARMKAILRGGLLIGPVSPQPKPPRGGESGRRCGRMLRASRIAVNGTPADWAAASTNARTSRGLASRRAAHLIGQGPIGECLGKMDAAYFVGAVEVGKGAGHPQHAMIAARRKPHGVGSFAQQRKPACVGTRHVFE